MTIRTIRTMATAIAGAIIGIGLAALPTTVVAQGSAAIQQGQDVYTARKCNVCHLIGDVGNKKGPSLDGVGAKLSSEAIRQWITNAPEMAGKANITRKPPMKAYTDLSKEDLDALVAYIASLKK